MAVTVPAAVAVGLGALGTAGAAVHVVAGGDAPMTVGAAVEVTVCVLGSRLA